VLKGHENALDIYFPQRNSFSEKGNYVKKAVAMSTAFFKSKNYLFNAFSVWSDLVVMFLRFLLQKY
jgi:hypothetical protein